MGRSLLTCLNGLVRQPDVRQVVIINGVGVAYNNDWQSTCNKDNYKDHSADSTSFISASYTTSLESRTILEKDFPRRSPSDLGPVRLLKTLLRKLSTSALKSGGQVMEDT